jgi:hypothetical protein
MKKLNKKVFINLEVFNEFIEKESEKGITITPVTVVELSFTTCLEIYYITEG